MNQSLFAKVRNCQPLPLASIPHAAFEEFKGAVLDAATHGGRISLLCAVPQTVFDSATVKTDLRLLGVVAWDEEGMLGILTTSVGKSYPSLTVQCPQVHWFEREIGEQWNCFAEGHPWLKPIRFHAPYATGLTRPTAEPFVGETAFYQLSGEEVHEVAVGPVHAGVIEPGHFRFQCHGENVYHLEISLGYQHRGIERALSAPEYEKRRLFFAETMAGDSTIAHATAYVQAVEAQSGLVAPPRAFALRGIALELERLANHTGDLGALAGDVGFLPTASFCGRIRGDFLNMTALLCGNRFGRGMIVPGGVGYDLDAERVGELTARLNAAAGDITGAAELLFNTPSVLSRFEQVGCVGKQACLDLGIVGPAARASGIRKDVRSDFPAGIYGFNHVPTMVWESGDVFGRAFVRWLEIRQSLEFICSLLPALPTGKVIADYKPKAPSPTITVSLVEGWRGEVCHCVVSNTDKAAAYYKVVDPSFHNWMALSMALRGQQISDFPLCNKSFNLSYCGHDL